MKPYNVLCNTTCNTSSRKLRLIDPAVSIGLYLLSPRMCSRQPWLYYNSQDPILCHFIANPTEHWNQPTPSQWQSVLLALVLQIIMIKWTTYLSYFRSFKGLIEQRKGRKSRCRLANDSSTSWPAMIYRTHSRKIHKPNVFDRRT